MTSQRKQLVQYLLLQYMEGVATEQELKQLGRLLQEETNDADWEELMEELLAIEPVMDNYHEKEWQPLLSELIEKNREQQMPVLRHISPWRKLAVAASVLFLLGTGIYFLFLKPLKPADITKVTTPADIQAPQTNHAMVTLANGQKVYLDSAANGQLAMQGNMKLVKLKNGQIEYNRESFSPDNGMNRELIYNTLSNPRGSKVINMILADGSKVWLNAGSSVTYPVAFTGNERKVKITGEAYFEVAHDKNRPFRVSFNTPAGGGEVEVLGTRFNVNAYDDEEVVRTTLLEGSVRVSVASGQLSVLKPGEQSVLTQHSRLTTRNDVGIDQVMAWKNGYFYFADADIQTVMRQLQRWYDLEVVYEGEISKDRFGGRLPRDASAADVLKTLQQTQVHFRIESRKLIVMP